MIRKKRKQEIRADVETRIKGTGVIVIAMSVPTANIGRDLGIEAKDGDHTREVMKGFETMRGPGESTPGIQGREVMNGYITASVATMILVGGVIHLIVDGEIATGLMDIMTEDSWQWACCQPICEVDVCARPSDIDHTIVQIGLSRP